MICYCSALPYIAVLTYLFITVWLYYGFLLTGLRPLPPTPETLLGADRPPYVALEADLLDPGFTTTHLFWTLNRLCVTTIAPVRAGKAEKCDLSAPARGIRTHPWTPGDRKSAPAHLPLEYVTRLFLEHSVLSLRFFFAIPARRTWGRRIVSSTYGSFATIPFSRPRTPDLGSAD